LDAHLGLGEDAEFASSAAPSLRDVDEDEDGAAAAGDPWRRRIERDGDGVERAEATEPVAGRGGSAHEVSHGGGPREVRAYGRLHRGAARAGAPPDRDLVDVDPDLLRREAPEHGLEASLLGRRIRPIFKVVVVTFVKAVVFLVISIKVVVLEFVVIVVVGEGGRGVSVAAGCSCHGTQWGGVGGCFACF
jgi:hypothetical protein